MSEEIKNGLTAKDVKAIKAFQRYVQKHVVEPIVAKEKRELYRRPKA